jgi:hypothetical protein
VLIPAHLDEQLDEAYDSAYNSLDPDTVSLVLGTGVDVRKIGFLFDNAST